MHLAVSVCVLLRKNRIDKEKKKRQKFSKRSVRATLCCDMQDSPVILEVGDHQVVQQDLRAALTATQQPSLCIAATHECTHTPSSSTGSRGGAWESVALPDVLKRRPGMAGNAVANRQSGCSWHCTVAARVAAVACTCVDAAAVALQQIQAAL
jgi:hypothetical protein